MIFLKNAPFSEKKGKNIKGNMNYNKQKILKLFFILILFLILLSNFGCIFSFNPVDTRHLRTAFKMTDLDKTYITLFLIRFKENKIK